MKNIYRYGSIVYETNGNLSDEDFVEVSTEAIVKEELAIDNTNRTIYPVKEFQELIEQHEISVLECLFLPEKHTVKLEIPFYFELNIDKLRRSLSAKSSNSWVKAKKKIDLHKEYRLGRKSLFHSFRILNFGIQIVKYGKIIDYTEANPIWLEIVKQNFETWKQYEDCWKQKYNKLRTEFRIAAPKEY